MTLEELKIKYCRFILWYDPYTDSDSADDPDRFPDTVEGMIYNLTEIFRELTADTSGDEDIETAAALARSLLADFREAGFKVSV